MANFYTMVISDPQNNQTRTFAGATSSFLYPWQNINHTVTITGSGSTAQVSQCDFVSWKDMEDTDITSLYSRNNYFIFSGAIDTVSFKINSSSTSNKLYGDYEVQFSNGTKVFPFYENAALSRSPEGSEDSRAAYFVGNGIGYKNSITNLNPRACILNVIHSSRSSTGIMLNNNLNLDLYNNKHGDGLTNTISSNDITITPRFQDYYETIYTQLNQEQDPTYLNGNGSFKVNRLNAASYYIIGNKNDDSITYMELQMKDKAPMCYTKSGTNFTQRNLAVLVRNADPSITERIPNMLYKKIGNNFIHQNGYVKVANGVNIFNAYTDVCAGWVPDNIAEPFKEDFCNVNGETAFGGITKPIRYNIAGSGTNYTNFTISPSETADKNKAFNVKFYLSLKNGAPYPRSDSRTTWSSELLNQGSSNSRAINGKQTVVSGLNNAFFENGGNYGLTLEITGVQGAIPVYRTIYLENFNITQFSGETITEEEYQFNTL